MEMSELREHRWAVISERGVEVSSVSYDNAVEVVERLGTEGVHGRCIVTDEAVARARFSMAATAGQ
jgi:hypothetical protein